eukprot:scaffold80177_cov41-Prasinocladus_malaysianus.AAC.3
MMYSSTKDFFKGQLDGISCSMQADDLSELTQDEIHSYVLQNMTRKPQGVGSRCTQCYLIAQSGCVVVSAQLLIYIGLALDPPPNQPI